MAPPPSQKYRQIGFLLSGGTGDDVHLDLNLRPEDLTRPEPSRLSVQQTLGGAWMDAFGRGLGTITLSGHTGWRGGFLLSGEDMFQALRSTVFQGWHDRRAAATKAGIDPNTVTLTFTDTLDSISVIVAPRSFQLRRSRTSPLLFRYQIQLLELGDASDPGNILDAIMAAFSNPLRWLAGVTGLGNLVLQIQYYADTAVAVLGSIATGVRTFLNTGAALISAVQSTAESLAGQFDASVSALLTTGQAYAAAGENVFSALAAQNVGTLSAQDMFPVMVIASQFAEAACIMKTSFNSALVYQSYDALMGASNCSSTSGGDPPSDFTVLFQNPWLSAFPAATPSPVGMTPAGQQALALLSADPLTLQNSTMASIGTLMSTAAAGVSLPP